MVMLKREVQAVYRGSFGGVLWLLVQPLAYMVIYTLVFSVFLKVRFTANESHLAFSTYLLCGLLPWLAFAEGLAGAMHSIRGNVNLVKRVVFPLEVLPAVKVLASAAQHAAGLLLLLPLAWWATGGLSPAALLFPLPIVMQLLFSLGIAWFFASASVFIPDLGQFLNPLLLMWMFMTPIFYSAEVVPAWARPILESNPMARIILLYRRILLEGNPPDLRDMLVTFLISISVFLLGFFFFKRTQKFFSEMV
jgi:lipopolysaccharide transport system permease protein